MPRSLLAVALAAAFGLAACGGGDRLSKTDYVKQADATCRKYEKRLQPLERELTETQSPQAAAKVIDRAIPVVREGVDELRDLKPPEDLEGRVDEWLDLNEKNTETLEKLRDAAKAGDEQKISELAREADENEKRGDWIAREIGLKDCAENDE